MRRTLNRVQFSAKHPTKAQLSNAIVRPQSSSNRHIFAKLILLFNPPFRYTFAAKSTAWNGKMSGMTTAPGNRTIYSRSYIGFCLFVVILSIFAFRKLPSYDPTLGVKSLYLYLGFPCGPLNCDREFVLRTITQVSVEEIQSFIELRDFVNSLESPSNTLENSSVQFLPEILY